MMTFNKFELSEEDKNQFPKTVPLVRYDPDGTRHVIGEATVTILDDEGLVISDSTLNQPFEIISAGDGRYSMRVEKPVVEETQVSTPPTEPCDGELHSVKDYPELYHEITYRFGGHGDQFRFPLMEGFVIVTSGPKVGTVWKLFEGRIVRSAE